MDLHALTDAPFTSDDGIAALLEAFHTRALPRSAWNHRAHLTVALSLARALAPADPLPCIRDAILAYNTSVGIVSTEDYGYHETLTALYAHIVSLHARRHPSPSSTSNDANALMEVCGDRDLPMRFYTRERLFSREARRVWIAPDLEPLPVV